MTFDQFLQSPVLLAIAGAVAGGLRAGVMSWRKNGKLRAVSDGLIGVVFAVGMADWLTPPAYPKAAALIGLLAGYALQLSALLWTCVAANFLGAYPPLNTGAVAYALIALMCWTCGCHLWTRGKLYRRARKRAGGVERE